MRKIAPDLAGKFAEEFSFVHAVLEGFAAVDKDDRDFVGELAAELFVGVDVDFLPAEEAAAFEFDQAFLDDLTKMAAFAGVDEDLASVSHLRSLAFSERISIGRLVKKSIHRAA